MLDIIWIIIGFILLVKGADFLVDGASSIAKRFHIPEIVIRTYHCSNWNIHARTCCKCYICVRRTF